MRSIKDGCIEINCKETQLKKSYFYKKIINVLWIFVVNLTERENLKINNTKFIENKNTYTIHTIYAKDHGNLFHNNFNDNDQNLFLIGKFIKPYIARLSKI